MSRRTIASRSKAPSTSASLSRLAAVLGLLVGTPQVATPGRIDVSYVPIASAYRTICCLFMPTNGLSTDILFKTQSAEVMFWSVWLAFCPIASPVTMAVQFSFVAICSATRSIMRRERTHAYFSGHLETISCKSGEWDTRYTGTS